MTAVNYDRIRAKLFGDHTPNPLLPLVKDRAGIRGILSGTQEEFSQVMYELSNGNVNKRSEMVAYEVLAKGKKDLLKFRDGTLFSVGKAAGTLGRSMIIITPFLPSMDDLLNTREMPLHNLVFDSLGLREIYKKIAYEYQREERRIAYEKAVYEAKISRESRLEYVLKAIEEAKTGSIVMIRGLQNIDALVELGFVPGLVDNPETWVDAEEFPGMRYRHAGSGIELLLIARERFRPIEELSRLEFNFLIHRSDGDSAAFKNMLNKFRDTNKDGTAVSMKAFHDDLIALVKYPEELKGRTEEDLGLMADEIGHVIDRRQELDKGVLPYDAVFARDTEAIIDHILKYKTPAGEIRKALDYFEYTGMIDKQYMALLHQRIKKATAAPAENAKAPGDELNDKRVKEIVVEVLKSIPKERLTSSSIMIAMSPYVNELGFGRLIKIRERILQLKEMVHV